MEEMSEKNGQRENETEVLMIQVAQDEVCSLLFKLMIS